MPFIGTQQKCKAWTLKLGNYSSMEGVLYCKPHFEQLFKETGNFNKNFQSPAKSAEKFTPELTRSPSKAASMFSGTQEKCATCGKTAYPLEKSYHKSCFKCSHGGCPISPSNYAALEGILYCKHHFSQLFKEKGSYNHLIKSASIKRAAATVLEARVQLVFMRLLPCACQCVLFMDPLIYVYDLAFIRVYVMVFDLSTVYVMVFDLSTGSGYAFPKAVK
ncbi:hypothetical protein HRI_002697500 [Hibiscus trionum]|uniref:LIM zinc-binding domain-containing protein n=1 Tax=Hibiscus trionum TaxID=183268 RepID=A0A9W7I830_HIBTR|nr:hypothetical protein HRI_002697500 [Hibiscus trionum]